MFQQNARMFQNMFQQNLFNGAFPPHVTGEQRPPRRNNNCAQTASPDNSNTMYQSHHCVAFFRTPYQSMNHGKLSTGSHGKVSRLFANVFAFCSLWHLMTYLSFLFFAHFLQ
jgi:hypothetical protein